MKELRFGSTKDALQHLANITGKKVRVAEEIMSTSEIKKALGSDWSVSDDTSDFDETFISKFKKLIGEEAASDLKVYFIYNSAVQDDSAFNGGQLYVVPGKIAIVTLQSESMSDSDFFGKMSNSEYCKEGRI